MGKYFVTIFILLYLWAGAPKSNNIFTSHIMYEYFSNVSAMQIYVCYRVRFIGRHVSCIFYST